MSDVNDHTVSVPDEGADLTPEQKAALDRRLALELEQFEGGIQG